MISYEIDVTAIEQYDAYLKRLAKGDMEQLITETFTKVAVNARRWQQAQIPKKYDRPTSATVNGVIFKSAKRSGDTISSSVQLKDFVAEYLGPTIVGAGYSNETERYGKGTILVPVVSVLKSRKTPASFNAFGNIKSLRNAAILKKLFKNKNVFNILITSKDVTHPPGIYFRQKNGPPLPLFLYVDDVKAKEVYDFFKVNEKAAEKIDDFFAEAIEEHVLKHCRLPTT